jgi:hypothetical protein
MENHTGLIRGVPGKFPRQISRFTLPIFATVVSALAPVSAVVALLVHCVSEMSAVIYVSKGLTK